MELKSVANYIIILTENIVTKNFWGKNEIREQMNEALLQLISQEDEPKTNR